MKSHTTARFRKAFQRLPPTVQAKARGAFRTWNKDSSHPSLRFKQVHQSKPICSVRIGVHWRAVGVKGEDVLIWFWIGSHEDHNNLLASL